MSRFPIVAAIACIVLSACGGSGSGSGGGGGSTPEDVFAKVNGAIGKKDHSAFIANVDPQQKESLIYMMAVGAKMTASFEQDAAKRAAAEKGVDAILARHGIAEKMAAGPSNLSDQALLAKTAHEALKDVKDQNALFIDLMTLLEQSGSDASRMKTGTLSDVKTDGDKASGTLTDAEGRKTPLHFIKRDGRWYFALNK